MNLINYISNIILQSKWNLYFTESSWVTTFTLWTRISRWSYWTTFTSVAFWSWHTLKYCLFSTWTFKIMIGLSIANFSSIHYCGHFSMFSNFQMMKMRCHHLLKEFRCRRYPAERYSRNLMDFSFSFFLYGTENH